MNLCGTIFVTNEEREILEILWGSQGMKNKYVGLWGWLKGHKLDEIFHPREEHHGIFAYQDEIFSFQKVVLWNYQLYLIRLGQDIQELYEQTMEHLPQGVQIYDREGHLIYLNEISRQISALPPKEDLIGKHLLDIWNLEPDISTTLSCLRERISIRHRIDTFLDANKGNITTINTAYPILCGNELQGAALFEMDLSITRQQGDYIRKLEEDLKRYTNQIPEDKMSGYNFDCIIGNSQSMVDTIHLAKRFAQQDSNILLVGETGTGKEVFAQSIHRASPRSGKPFVAINCAAFPESLIEGMLFGTRKGAFTGSEDKKGLFEEANGGTLFLDEVNSMSLAMQSKLLRVLQEGVFRRIGSSKDFHTDVRIISSCNENPFELLEHYTMRRDLFYRLSTVQLHLPPLRERPEDIPTLVDYYLERKRAIYAKHIDYISPQVMELFHTYQWPGNVRELFHVLEYILNVTDGGVITVENLPKYILSQADAHDQNEPTHSTPQNEPSFVDSTLEVLIGEYEANIIKRVLEHHGGNISRAARSLGISRQSLGYRIKKYGIII